MRKVVIGFIVIALSSPLAAETWKGVTLMDAGCAAKKDVMAQPDNHSKSCMMQCSKAGYGAMVDGKFVKFDKKGDKLAAAALKKTASKDHLRANIMGEMKGGTIRVSSMTVQ